MRTWMWGHMYEEGRRGAQRRHLEGVAKVTGPGKAPDVEPLPGSHVLIRPGEEGGSGAGGEDDDADGEADADVDARVHLVVQAARDADAAGARPEEPPRQQRRTPAPAPGEQVSLPLSLSLLHRPGLRDPSENEIPAASRRNQKRW